MTRRHSINGSPSPNPMHADIWSSTGGLKHTIAHSADDTSGSTPANCLPGLLDRRDPWRTVGRIALTAKQELGATQFEQVVEKGPTPFSHYVVQLHAFFVKGGTSVHKEWLIIYY